MMEWEMDGDAAVVGGVVDAARGTDDEAAVGAGIEDAVSGTIGNAVGAGAAAGVQAESSRHATNTIEMSHL